MCDDLCLFSRVMEELTPPALFSLDDCLAQVEESSEASQAAFWAEFTAKAKARGTAWATQAMAEVGPRGAVVETPPSEGSPEEAAGVATPPSESRPEEAAMQVQTDSGVALTDEGAATLPKRKRAARKGNSARGGVKPRWIRRKAPPLPAVAQEPSMPGQKPQDKVAEDTMQGQLGKMMDVMQGLMATVKTLAECTAWAGR